MINTANIVKIFAKRDDYVDGPYILIHPSGPLCFTNKGNLAREPGHIFMGFKFEPATVSAPAEFYAPWYERTENRRLIEVQARVTVEEIPITIEFLRESVEKHWPTFTDLITPCMNIDPQTTIDILLHFWWICESELIKLAKKGLLPIDRLEKWLIDANRNGGRPNVEDYIEILSQISDKVATPILEMLYYRNKDLVVQYAMKRNLDIWKYMYPWVCGKRSHEWGDRRGFCENHYIGCKIDSYINALVVACKRHGLDNPVIIKPGKIRLSDGTTIKFRMSNWGFPEGWNRYRQKIITKNATPRGMAAVHDAYSDASK
jgi:hypothetical protein